MTHKKIIQYHSPAFSGMLRRMVLDIGFTK